MLEAPPEDNIPVVIVVSTVPLAVRNQHEPVVATTQHPWIRPQGPMVGRQSDVLNLFVHTVVGARLGLKHCVHRVRDVFCKALFGFFSLF